MKKYPYMISPDYCKDWTSEMAVREVIANAIDTKTQVDITKDNDGIVTVADHGKGLKAKDMLLGQSDKKAGQIGQFGEGLKIGALVMARQGRPFRVYSNGAKYEFTIEHDKEFDSAMLVVAVSETGKHRTGTAVEFEVRGDELEKAKDKFLYFRGVNEIEYGIIDRPGEVYVMGVFAQKFNALWGYNFRTKNMMNRDRSLLNQWDVENAIGNALARSKTATIMDRYFENADRDSQKLEHRAYFNPQNREAWRNAMKRRWPGKICLSDGNGDSRAVYLRYRVVDVSGAVARLMQILGVKYANQVAPKKKVARNVKVTDLPTDEQQVLDIVKRLGKKMVPGSWWVQVVEKNDERLGCQDRNRIEISREQLKTVRTAAGTLMHELGHYKGGNDCSSLFEGNLTRLLGQLVKMYLSKK